LKKIHTRTLAMEIFGHEFWSADGKTIWYDLQTPRGEDFWLAGYQVETGERTWYHLQRDEWIRVRWREPRMADGSTCSARS
jgi:oligogalacturonide lyase